MSLREMQDMYDRVPSATSSDSTYANVRLKLDDSSHRAKPNLQKTQTRDVFSCVKFMFITCDKRINIVDNFIYEL